MLKEDWFAAAEDEIHPRWYRKGETLTGELLARAEALGLTEVADATNKPRRGRRVAA